jgi:hypothetical protein
MISSSSAAAFRVTSAVMQISVLPPGAEPHLHPMDAAAYEASGQQTAVRRTTPPRRRSATDPAGGDAGQPRLGSEPTSRVTGVLPHCNGIRGTTKEAEANRRPLAARRPPRTSPMRPFNAAERRQGAKTDERRGRAQRGSPPPAWAAEWYNADRSGRTPCGGEQPR